MFNPVEIPLPVFLTLLAALAIATWQVRRWLEDAYPLTFGPVQNAAATPTPRAGGRHRPGADRKVYGTPGWRQPTTQVPVLPTPVLPEPLPQRVPGEALAVELEEADALWEIQPVSAPPAVENRDAMLTVPVAEPAWRFAETTALQARTHPAPCGYPDLLPCICSVQQADAPNGIPDGDTRELEPVQ